MYRPRIEPSDVAAAIAQELAQAHDAGHDLELAIGGITLRIDFLITTKAVAASDPLQRNKGLEPAHSLIPATAGNDAPWTVEVVSIAAISASIQRPRHDDRMRLPV